MPLTPDDVYGGVTDAAKIIMRDEGLTTAAGGEAIWNGTAWQMQDALGVFDPREQFGEAEHNAVRQLIHFIDDGPADGFASGAVKDTTFTGAFPTSEVWYESAARTQKIVQLDVTYTGALPTAEVWRMYDTDGVTVLVTLTDAITYSGAFESTRTRTWA
jgi:hypothetical protein